MGSKLSPPDQELYQRTDEVLHYVWDPIGVADAPTARDEYYGYLPQVSQLLKDDADAAAIADYLCKVETERMGMSVGNRKNCLKVAELLLEWKAVISEKNS